MLKVGATLCQVETEGENEGEEVTPESNQASSEVPTSSSTSAISEKRTSVQQFKLADIGEGITECEVVQW